MEIIQSAIVRGGGLCRLAAAVGVTHQSIYSWQRRGLVPAERVRAVSKATGIPPHRLRPDLYDPPVRQRQRQRKR